MLYTQETSRLGIIKPVRALCFCAFMLQLPFLVQKVNDTFRPAKISIDFPFNPAWESPLPSTHIIDTLSRPFLYLGRGAQAFVFESEDGKFVLKLFRGSPKIHPWMHFVQHHLLGKKKRRSAAEKIPPLFAACTLAYTKAPELTGLTYMHLNATKNNLPTTHLINRMKRKIPIDLNQCRFILQKKGRSIADTFRAAVAENDQAKYLRLAESFVSLLKERTLKNIGNLDRTIWYNFGFVGETAIEWDFGRYYDNPYFNDRSVRECEMRIFTDSLQRFLDSIAPDWKANLEDLF